MYQHQFVAGKKCEFPVGKVVCVGRNYADHIAELNNETPSEPLLFIKANNAMVAMHQDVVIPAQGECHNELELALLIGQPLSCVSVEEAKKAVAGIGLALDLTLRDVQTQLKQKGLPWERAKGFDGSCPLSQFVCAENVDLEKHFEFQLKVNDVVRQLGNTQHMLWPWPELIAHISHTFSLFPGDVVLTGTPKGVGPLNAGDRIAASLGEELQVETRVVQMTKEAIQ